jgi:hypothetical protein
MDSIPAKPITSKSVDENGNIVIETTNTSQIQNNTVVQNFVTSVTKTHT